MLYKILENLAASLNDYLKLRFGLSDDIVCLASIRESGSTIPVNRVSISLINIERDTAAGISFGQQQAGQQKARSAPNWQIKVYLLFSVIFDQKQYADSLRVLSSVLSFIQKNSQLALPRNSATYTIEPVNLSFSELSNLWSIHGGTYHPSIVCQLRLITIDEQEIESLSTSIEGGEVNLS